MPARGRYWDAQLATTDVADVPRIREDELGGDKLFRQLKSHGYSVLRLSEALPSQQYLKDWKSFFENATSKERSDIMRKEVKLDDGASLQWDRSRLTGVMCAGLEFFGSGYVGPSYCRDSPTMYELRPQNRGSEPQMRMPESCTAVTMLPMLSEFH